MPDADTLWAVLVVGDDLSAVGRDDGLAEEAHGVTASEVGDGVTGEAAVEAGEVLGRLEHDVGRELARVEGPVVGALCVLGYAARPDRFVNKPPVPPAAPVAAWINPPKEIPKPVPDLP